MMSQLAEGWAFLSLIQIRGLDFQFRGLDFFLCHISNVDPIQRRREEETDEKLDMRGPMKVSTVLNQTVLWFIPLFPFESIKKNTLFSYLRHSQ